jgi:hypothetical protein
MSRFTGKTDEGGEPKRGYEGRRWVKWVTWIIVCLVVLILFWTTASPHFYLFKQVGPSQVGVRIRGGQIAAVVPPGVYSDVGLFVELNTYSASELRFSVSDPEVITKDQQRIGVTLSGSVFRPSWADENKVKTLFSQYRSVFLNDEALQKVMNDLSMQAMKVCVGDRLFSESVIGSDRDLVGQCMRDELTDLIKPYGLSIANIVVPNVTLSPEVQAKLDAITQSRLDTEKALQDEKKAVAEGKANQAETEASIRVEQSRKQEETRQQTTLAQLDQEKLKAQQAVITQQKANDLLSAQKDLEIAQARSKAASEQAKADKAVELFMADLLEKNPNYYNFLVAQANASAIKDTDKFFFSQDGKFPYFVFGSGTPGLNLPATPNN